MAREAHTIAGRVRDINMRQRWSSLDGNGMSSYLVLSIRQGNKKTYQYQP
jgi:hypothetical protein